MKRFMTVLTLLFAIFSVFSICACGEQSETPDEGHTHVYGDPRTTAEPTCTKKGVRIRLCSCGDVLEEPIPAKGHAFSEEFTIDKDPTCSAVGIRSKHCTREGCDATSEQEEIPLKEHEYGEWEETLAATCTEAGKREKKCKNCDHTESEELQKLGHDFVGGTVVKEATCTEDGILSGGICSRCQKPGDNEPIQHLGHSFTGEETVVKDASCTEKGEKTVKCIRCDETEEKTVPALGHKWEVVKESEPNPCGDKSTDYFCTVCQETKTETVVGKNHQWSDYTYYSGVSCSAEGRTEVRVCINCNKQDFKSTPSKGMHWADDGYYIYREPTETTEGIRYKLCRSCGEIIPDSRESIPVIKKTGTITYSVNVCRDIALGTKFANEFTVKVYEGGSLVTTVQTQSAVATFELPAKNYTVKLENLPEGYIAAENGYSLTPENSMIRAELSAALLEEGKTNPRGYYVQGDVIHDFTFKDYYGTIYKLSDLLKEHKFVVFDYYFTTCGYCNSEFTYEHNQGMEKRLGDDFLFIYVNGSGEVLSTVETHAEKYHIEGIFVNGRDTANYTNLMTYFASHNYYSTPWGYPTKITIDYQGVLTNYTRGDTMGSMVFSYESLLTVERVCTEDLHMPERYLPSDPEETD